MIRNLAPVAAQLLKVMPRKRLSWCLGQLAEVGAPTPVLDALVAQFVDTFEVDLSEVAQTGPYGTFDAFFTRKLREGTRPIDPRPESLVSPADGRLEDFGEIDDDLSLVIKNHRYNLMQLLEGVAQPEQYRGGKFAVIYLSPRDYHRVHAPVEGKLIDVVHVPGTLFPVNAIGVSHIKGLFGRNERVAFVQDTQNGRVCSLMVGAIGVGRITTKHASLVTNRGSSPAKPVRYESDANVSKGEELGVFHLGSTVILILSRTQASGLQWLQPMRAQVRMGEALSLNEGAA